MISRISQKVGAFLFIMALVLLTSVTVYAALTINLVAVNPKEVAKEIEVRYELPKELEPEDVLDAGPLEIDYDVDLGKYYVSAMVKFNPKESKTFKIKVNDVWFISQQEVEVLNQQLATNLSLLEGKENYNLSRRAASKLTEQIEFIMAQQANYSNNIERRIEEYRAYAEMMNEIKDNIYSLDYLENESKVLEEIDESRTIKLKLEVTNSDKENAKDITHNHYLPEKVRSDHVVESQGFEVRYDENKKRSYLSKEEKFNAGETKKYTISIRDIWHVPLTKVEAIENRAKVAFDELIGSVYEESGKFLFDKIIEKLDLIKTTQEVETTIRKHIGRFKINRVRLEQAEEDLLRIELMMAIVRAKKLEELESGKVKNVLQRLQALRGLAALSEALFKKGISVTVTWRIIFGTIIFVGLFTTIHFTIWARRSKAMGEEGAPDDGVVTEVPKPGQEGDDEDDD